MSLACRNALTDDLVGKTKLIVEFQGARLNHHGARMLARPFGFGNKPEPNSAAGQAQCQIKASWSGPDDQGTRLRHIRARNSNTPGIKRRGTLSQYSLYPRRFLPRNRSSSKSHHSKNGIMTAIASRPQ